MSLIEDFFADAEEAIEMDLPTAKEQAKQVLEQWSNKNLFGSVIVFEAREYRTDKDTYFLAQLDNKDLAKFLEKHYKEFNTLKKAYDKQIDKCKSIEELDTIVVELLEDEE